MVGADSYGGRRHPKLDIDLIRERIKRLKEQLSWRL
jgi:hypothetical protein